MVIKNKIIAIITLICTVSAGNAYGQDFIPAWKVSVGGGYMNYFGDVSPYTIKHWSDWDNVFKFFQYNQYYIPSASYGVTVERYLSPGISLMLQLNEGTVSMSDRYRKPNGDYDRDAIHWDRALNFKTKIKDAGLNFVFRSNNGRMFPINSFLAPYFLAGGGITHFKVKGDLYDAGGNPYNYADPGTQPDGTYETSLRPLLTETSKAYPDVVPYVDAGLGLSVNISKRVGLAIQTDIKYAFSDYIDDVSGQYKTKYNSDDAAYAAHPGTNVVTPNNANRGNNDGINDFYIFNKISLNINLGNKANHRFHAPAIYLPESFKFNDSIAIRDTAVNIPDSSLEVTKKLPDTSTRQVSQELQQIKSELFSLRFAYLDQNYIIRQHAVRQNIDTLQARKMAPQGHKKMTTEDSLIVRLYDYQVDSLHNELMAIHNARLQLRREMAYSPIITEYEDSTKIMIYKGHSDAIDSLYLPLTEPLPMIMEDTIQHVHNRNINKELDRDTLYSDKDTFYYLTPADTIRNELSRLKQEAAIRKDTVLYQHLQSINRRLDSLENNEDVPVNAPIDSLTREHYIRRDSMQIMELSLQADSLRQLDSMSQRIDEPENRNAIQRFFDKFKKKKQLYQESDLPPTTDTTNYYPDNTNQAKIQEYEQNNEGYQDYPSTPDNETRRLLQQNQEEIKRLQDDIRSLRANTSSGYNEPPTVIYRDNNNNQAREARLDRRQMRELSGAVVAAGAIAGAQKNPASPTIIIPPNYGNSGDSAALQDIRRQLKVLQEQYDTANQNDTADDENEKWAQAILKDTIPADNENETVGLLQSKIDSLSQQLIFLKQKSSVDTVSKVSSLDNNVLMHYPTVSMYFAIGEASLSDAEKEKIKPFATVAQAYPQARLLIEGFTDGTGDKRINEILSKKRCATVKQILVQQYGIQENRLIIETNLAKERGNSNPLKRRVDLKFME